MHKYIYIGLICLCLGAGIYGYNSGRRASELDQRIGELIAENERISAEIGDITAESERLATELQRANGKLSEYELEAGSIAAGLSETFEGIHGVLERMRAYAEKSQP